MVERRDGVARSPDDVRGDTPLRVRDDNEVTEKAETDVDVDTAMLSSDSAIFIVRGSSQIGVGKRCNGHANEKW